MWPASTSTSKACSTSPAKAARFPGKELLWDKASLTFTNHDEATNTIVRRRYRQGFELPVVAG